MHAQGMGGTTALYNGLIASLGQAGRAEDAIEVFLEMQLAGVSGV